MGIGSWLLVSVLIAVPLILLFLRRIRRRHWPILLIIWLVALLGWMLIDHRWVMACFQYGYERC